MEKQVLQRSLNENEMKIQTQKPKFRVYNLTKNCDKIGFINCIEKYGFGLIEINDEYSNIINKSFDYSKKNLFKKHDTTKLKCDYNQAYTGYVNTKNVKQSLWFYKDSNNSLFPNILSLKNKKKIYQNIFENIFDSYQSIGNACLDIIFDHICVNPKAKEKCLQLLFPELNPDDKYRKSRVYHDLKKKHSLSNSNLAFIHYYANKNKIKVTCEEHIDYTLITLISCLQNGLYIRNCYTFDLINIHDIICQNGYKNNKSKVVCVLSGQCLGKFFGKIPAMHSVKKIYQNDRISSILFMYPSPNGIIDKTLVKPKYKDYNDDTPIINCAKFIGKHIHDSVNFKT